METSIKQLPQESSDLLSPPLPPFDKALGTRKWCIRGLVFCYILSIALVCIGVAFWNLVHYHLESCDGPNGPKWPYFPGIRLSFKSSVEVLLLSVNLMVTLATECVGYIHATSLRWALYHEDRLRHNSNLRLFTSSKRSMPNRWFVNVLWFLLMTASYSCASQFIITASYAGGGDGAVVSSLSLIILGCCLLVSVLLACVRCRLATTTYRFLSFFRYLQHGRCSGL